MSSSLSNVLVKTKKFSYLSVYRRALSYAAGTRVVLSVYMTLTILVCLICSLGGWHASLSPVPFTFFSWHLLSYSLCVCLYYVLQLYITRTVESKEMSTPVKWWYKDIKSFLPGLLWVAILGAWFNMSIHVFLVAPRLHHAYFVPALLVYFLVVFLVNTVIRFAVMHQVYQRESAMKSLCFSIRSINRYIWRSIFFIVFYLLFNFLLAAGSGLLGSIAFILFKAALHHGPEVLLLGLATVFAIASAICACVLIFRYGMAFLFFIQSLYIEIFGSLSKRRPDEVKHM